MTVAYPLALAPLSVLPAGPLEQIDAAIAGGFAMVGMRLCPVSPTDPVIMADADLRKDIKSRLADTELTVLDIEVFRVGPRLDVDSHLRTMEFGAELGASHILCTFPLRTEGTRDDENASVAKLVEFCDQGEQFGLRPMLEFMQFRLMGSLDDALRIAGKAAHPNLGICVDVLHLMRSGGRPSDLRKVDPRLLPYCQVCDAPAASPGEEKLPYEARYDRLVPGAGGLPLLEILRELPKGLPLCVEVPEPAGRAQSPITRGEILGAATRRLVTELSV